MDSVITPDFYEEMLDHLMNLYLKFVDYTADLPIDAIMFGDDWGDQRGIILGPELWRKLLKPRWAKIYDAVHAKGKLVISHCCGSMIDVMPDVIEMGLDVLESVQPEARGMNPYELKKNWGDKITFWGCLGTQSTILMALLMRLKERSISFVRKLGVEAVLFIACETITARNANGKCGGCRRSLHKSRLILIGILGLVFVLRVRILSWI